MRPDPKVEHPCFSCSLPDCDEKDTQCALKGALRAVYAFRRAKNPAPDNVRLAGNIAYRELYGDQHRKRSSAWQKNARAARRQPPEAEPLQVKK